MKLKTRYGSNEKLNLIQAQSIAKFNVFDQNKELKRAATFLIASEQKQGKKMNKIRHYYMKDLQSNFLDLSQNNSVSQLNLNTSLYQTLKIQEKSENFNSSILINELLIRHKNSTVKQIQKQAQTYTLEKKKIRGNSRLYESSQSQAWLDSDEYSDLLPSYQNSSIQKITSLDIPVSKGSVNYSSKIPITGVIQFNQKQQLQNQMITNQNLSQEIRKKILQRLSRLRIFSELIKKFQIKVTAKLRMIDTSLIKNKDEFEILFRNVQSYYHINRNDGILRKKIEKPKLEQWNQLNPEQMMLIVSIVPNAINRIVNQFQSEDINYKQIMNYLAQIQSQNQS